MNPTSIAPRWLAAAYLLLVFVLASTVAFGQVDIPACGNEGQRACTPSDPESQANNLVNVDQKCDYGLADNSGTCVNSPNPSDHPRWQWPPNTSWVGWALAEQRYGVGGDAPINYVTTIGTHNSFSNVSGGFSANVSTDHVYSISDQLNLGARYVRIDGYYFHDQMRVCHGNTGLCSTLSYTITPGRLFANAVKEVAVWLSQHPSEFIVLDLNGDPGSYPYLVMDPILQYLVDAQGRSTVVNKSDFLSGGSPMCTGTWPGCYFPSLNYLRNVAKRQVLIIANNYNEYTASQQQYLFDRYWEDEVDQYSGVNTKNDLASCSDPVTANTSGVMSRHLNYIWPYSSEDRTGSVIISPSSWLGYLDEPQVTELTNCAYSLITLDFLNSRSQTVLPPFATPITTDKDDRFAASIWSFDANDYGVNGYAYMKINGRWSSQPTSAAMNFACSTSTTFDPNALWTITASTGTWDQGESNCQALGSQWHFSHPYNGAQNSLLYAKAVLIGLTAHVIPNVWLNYRTQQLPSALHIDGSLDFGSSTPTGLIPITFSLFPISSVSVANCTTEPCWLTFSTASKSGGLTDTITPAVNNPASLPPGLYQANLVAHDLNQTSVPAVVQVRLLVTNTTTFQTPSSIKVVAATTPVSGFINVKTNGPASLPMTAVSDQPWLKVSVGGNAPSNIAFTADPSTLSTGIYSANVTISSPYTASVKASVTLIVVPFTTVTTNPAGLPITVDGVSYTSPQTFAFDPSLSHTASVPASVSVDGKTQYGLQGWNSGHTPDTSVRISAPLTATDTTLFTANFNITGYAVQFSVVPSLGGMVSASPLPVNGFYAPGTPITLTAKNAAGFAFASFSGTTASNTNPLTFTLSSPVDEVANFAPAGSNWLAVNTSGSRTNAGGVESVPLSLFNNGTAGAVGIRITSIDSISTVSGSGAVTLLSAVPITIGDLAPGSASSAFTVQFNWPATAFRVRFTVHFAANGGQYVGSTTVTISR